MPSISEKQLFEHIKNNSPDRLYFIYGEEQYMKKLCCDRLIAVGCTDFPDLNLLVMPFETAKTADLYNAVNTCPVLSDRRCVVLDDVDAEKISSDDFKSYEDIFKNIPAETVLIVCQTNKAADFKKSAKWKKLLKLAEKYGSAVEILRRTSGELASMLTDYAKNRGCKLQKNDAFYLIEICSVKLSVLYGELDKLISFTQSGEITRQAIDSLVIKSTEASVFDLSKRILQRDAEGAFRILNLLLQNREEPVMILATLSNAFCDVYRAKCAESNSAKPESIANDFDYRGREFRLRNAARDSRNTDLGQAKKCLRVLRDADITLKSTRSDPAAVLQNVVMELILAIAR
ncbi:MAG: DNA polymerase III subunit delta [Clostridia bacterium]|nr:DNA polymerase III subunit delta [Clostridia bacterium]